MYYEVFGREHHFCARGAVTHIDTPREFGRPVLPESVTDSAYEMIDEGKYLKETLGG